MRTFYLLVAVICSFKEMTLEVCSELDLVMTDLVELGKLLFLYHLLTFGTFVFHIPCILHTNLVQNSVTVWAQPLYQKC